MVRMLLARLYQGLGKFGSARVKRETSSAANPAARARGKVRLHVEGLESRVTPSNGSALVPAFYHDLLHRPPDPGATGFLNAIDGGTRASVIAYQIETAAGNEYRYGLVQSYFVRFLHRPGSATELMSFASYLSAGA